MLDMIVVTNSSPDKIALLQKIDLQLEKTKIHLRIAFDLKAVSSGSFEVLNRQIEDIGRQLGGWRKWAEKQNCPPIPARVPAN